MITADQIIKAIQKLPEDELRKILNWIADYEWKAWDKQIGQDADSGKLDFLMQEAIQEKETSRRL